MWYSARRRRVADGAAAAASLELLDSAALEGGGSAGGEFIAPTLQELAKGMGEARHEVVEAARYSLSASLATRVSLVFTLISVTLYTIVT